MKQVGKNVQSECTSERKYKRGKEFVEVWLGWVMACQVS
jgi:hypothetical protein